jgi:hypothetical protein
LIKLLYSFLAKKYVSGATTMMVTVSHTIIDNVFDESIAGPRIKTHTRTPTITLAYFRKLK